MDYTAKDMFKHPLTKRASDKFRRGTRGAVAKIIGLCQCFHRFGSVKGQFLAIDRQPQRKPDSKQDQMQEQG